MVCGPNSTHIYVSFSGWPHTDVVDISSFANRVYKITPQLRSQLHHFASFPQTGISLRQMVQFGRHPNPGTILQAGTFLAGESAHARVIR